MNKSWFEEENSRVPALLIGLSKRSLLEGNRKLMILTAIKLIRHLIFDIVLIKGNATEKEMKEKRREPEDGDAQQITHEVPPNN